MKILWIIVVFVSARINRKIDDKDANPITSLFDI